MPGKNTNVSGAFTELTQLVDEEWRKSGLSQVDFIKRLRVDCKDQTLSKFIRGRFRKPPPGLIEALSKHTGITEDVLRQKHRTAVNVNETPIPSGRDSGGFSRRYLDSLLARVHKLVAMQLRGEELDEAEAARIVIEARALIGAGERIIALLAKIMAQPPRQ